jgi:hypothetical protein
LGGRGRHRHNADTGNGEAIFDKVTAGKAAESTPPQMDCGVRTLGRKEEVSRPI